MTDVSKNVVETDELLLIFCIARSACSTACVALDMASNIERMPKAELHVHIEGCLEPEMVLQLAKRNNIQHKLPYKTLAEAEAAFQYNNLQEFLDLRDATLQVAHHISSWHRQPTCRLLSAC